LNKFICLAVGYALGDYCCVLDKSLSGLIYLMGCGAVLSASVTNGVGVLIDRQLSGDRRVLAGKK
jgi:hypothetical protein